jgi:hypothetical protein
MTSDPPDDNGISHLEWDMSDRDKFDALFEGIAKNSAAIVALTATAKQNSADIALLTSTISTLATAVSQAYEIMKNHIEDNGKHPDA